MLVKEIRVFGFEVPAFPQGVKEAFEKLIGMLPAGEGRPCFGLSTMKDNGDILYVAAMEEKEKGEAEKNRCSGYKIEKGNYLSITLTNWMSQLDAIKDSFDVLMQQPGVDPHAWCIEWYKDDNEMMCMVKMLTK